MGEGLNETLGKSCSTDDEGISEGMEKRLNETLGKSNRAAEGTIDE